MISREVALGVLSVAMVSLPLLGVSDTYARNDRSNEYRGRQVILDVAENAAPNSTVLHHRSELWYMVLVEKRRQDLTLVDPFWHNKDVGHADIVWPDDLDLPTTDRRYGTGEFLGAESATIAAKGGPVYILRQDDVSFQGPYEAGFRTAHVQGVCTS